MLKIDYRKSHTAPGKGMSYEKSFNEHSYRKYVSSWEKKILENLVNKCFQGDLKIRYLDFACGTGRIIGYMEDLVDTSIGVDISDSML